MPRAVDAPNELATILYYASRGFTPEAIRYFLRKKTGRSHTYIALIIDAMERFSADGGCNGKPQIFDSRTRMWHLDGVDNKIEELWGASEGGIAHITKFTPEDDFAVLTGEFGEPASMRQQLKENLRNLGWGVPREPGITLKMIPERDVFFPYAGPGAVGSPKGAPRPHPVPVFPPRPLRILAPVTGPEANYVSPYPPPPGGWTGPLSNGSREVKEYESPYSPPPGGWTNSASGGSSEVKEENSRGNTGRESGNSRGRRRSTRVSQSTINRHTSLEEAAKYQRN